MELRKKITVLEKKDLNRLLYGATFLGSGGGGMIASGEKFIQEILSIGKGINLITFPLSEEEKENIGCVVCDIGSITAFDDNQSKALEFAYKALSKEFRNLGDITALFPIEVGPENILAPFVLAARLGISVVDGDGARRAVPTLLLSTFLDSGIKNYQPVAISNGEGDFMLVWANNENRYDGLLRTVAHLPAFKNSASLALWPDTLQQLSKNCIQGSITKTLNCGELLEGLKGNNEELIRESIDSVNELEGFLITYGSIITKFQKEEEAFNFTTTKIRNQIDQTEIITVISQNESLLAFSNKSYNPVAIAPDSICYLDKGFNPYTNAEIDEMTQEKTEGYKEVYLIGIKADSRLHDEDICRGFEEIIQNLGYAGNMDIYPDNVEKLGDLLLRLRNEDHFGFFKNQK